LPPGHWSRIGEYVSRRDLHSLDTDVQMFFALNNALLDAGISAWAVKRTFNSERPITAVHYLYTGQQVCAWAGPGKGAQWIDGGTWMPYQPANVVTPPFAEYTSGHSTFSFAATAVLQYFTGSDSFGASVIIPAGSSTVEPGITPVQPVTLYFSTFTPAASQAGLSRRYGGIHYVAGDLGGRADGFNIGQSDWTQAVTYFNGGTPCNVKTNGNGNSYGRYKKQSSYCSSLANDWLSYSYSAINGLGSYGSTGGGGTPNTSGGGSGNGGSGNGGSGGGDDGHDGGMSGGDSQGTHDDHADGGWSSAGGLDN